jgi:hypothetical protein
MANTGGKGAEGRQLQWQNPDAPPCMEATGGHRAVAARMSASETIAVMPNDTEACRDDSFENMQAFAATHGFTFPYVIDATQQVARAYGVQCTSDFFGFKLDPAPLCAFGLEKKQ